MNRHEVHTKLFLAGSLLQGAKAACANPGARWNAAHQYGLTMDVGSPDALGVALGVAYIIP